MCGLVVVDVAGIVDVGVVVGGGCVVVGGVVGDSGYGYVVCGSGCWCC